MSEINSNKHNMLTEKMVGVLDVNGDGVFNIEDVIIMGLRVPGVRISRRELFYKEFQKKYPSDIIEQAIVTTPVKAGISRGDVDCKWRIPSVCFAEQNGRDA